MSFRTAQETQRNPFLTNKTAKERKKRIERKKTKEEETKKKIIAVSSYSLIYWHLKNSQAELETRVSFITGKPETVGGSQED